MSKVSIVVPVYNTGKYIKRCLNSILNQTKSIDCEVIVINDGSTDNSEEIIKKYIEENKDNFKIRYFSKENEGIAQTRNYGIKKSTSKYIMFLDSDDYIESKTFEILDTYIEQDIDLIKFKLKRVNEKGDIIEHVDGPIFEEITGEQAFNKLYCSDVLLDSPCVYLIKKKLFTENNFKFQRTYHEDYGLIPFIILVAKTVVSISEYLYNYVQVLESITRTEDYNKIIKKMDDVLFHYDNMIKMLESIRLEKITKENVKIYYTNATILKLQELRKESQPQYIKEIRKRKIHKNIKVRDFKQLIKRILLTINIKLYLKLR